MSAPTNQTFPFSETDMAREFGLSRAMLRNARGEKGTDWELGPNGLVMWSAIAREKLVAALSPKSDLPATAIEEEKPAPPAAPPDPTETLTVSTKRVPNPRLVLGVRKTGEVVKVYIGGNAHLFWHPMKLLAVPGVNHLWNWTGNPDAPKQGRRLPRSKGRW